MRAIIPSAGTSGKISAMKNVLVLTKDHEAYRTLIAAELPDVNIVTKPDDDCEIVLGAPSLISETLDKLPKLKWAQATWAGVEPLLDPALRHDYFLTNARGVFGYLMSEYVIGYLLAHERKIFQRVQAQKNREWDKTITGRLRGKTIGLLGVGSIGAEVARTAKFFGMTVRGYTRENEASTHVDRYFHGGELLEFARGLDYLVSILPNTKETRRIVDADLLAALPPHEEFADDLPYIRAEFPRGHCQGVHRELSVVRRRQAVEVPG
jgi:phosphoglycerate dehydrogenase-like enzyme